MTRPPVHIDQQVRDKAAEIECVRLTLRAEGRGGAPVSVRIRRLLKAALRTYGLRCTSIEEHKPEGRP